MRAEKSPDAVVLHVPGLIDSVETAARMAAGKHLLEIHRQADHPQPAIKTETVVAFDQIPGASSDCSCLD